MKIKLTLFLLLTIAIGCKNNEDQLNYEPLKFESQKCEDCPDVKISTFNFTDDLPIVTTINNKLEREVINQLLYDDDIKVETIDKAIASFKNGFLELKKMYSDETVGWEASIKAAITFENKDVITIQLDSYIFTGGAHGYSVTRFLNFDKKKGDYLENWQLFSDKNDFEHFASIKFKIQEDIPQNASINSTGFMFEDESFYLPKNIGFTKKGLQLLYNQYEVASYADGPIIITLPYNEINKFLALKIKKK
ncbi:DUF3298 and DUF4163 domain-containing protein [Cellulophaga baltica]|uniref:DUF3298 and DUF4163 domain-containing protein n=1 Tax=Cellulophaga TaxID=104264 RepID=UPI001C071E64|nr:MULTISPECIES: DUF3298 and DUF4163 domain-containing protein [Cellulophaga]MBU2995704.1 DUF3298 and DUF4163 domain-containing protein [Cellulophaga baltica]MDO6767098.1 DUF4163 domain-containing protein [Cellulophaga sp. 1_MG-2023]